MQAMLYTTNTSLIGNHEVLFFNDNHMEIEGLQEQEASEGPLYEQVCLSEEEQYKLYMLLHVKYSK